MTSGTAAAELTAAVVEADLAGVPLVVVTADRPPELRGVGAPQTIDQVKLFGGAVRRYEDPGTIRSGLGAVVAPARRTAPRRRGRRPADPCTSTSRSSSRSTPRRPRCPTGRRERRAVADASSRSPAGHGRRARGARRGARRSRRGPRRGRPRSRSSTSRPHARLAAARRPALRRAAFEHPCVVSGLRRAARGTLRARGAPARRRRRCSGRRRPRGPSPTPRRVGRRASLAVARAGMARRSPWARERRRSSRTRRVGYGRASSRAPRRRRPATTSLSWRTADDAAQAVLRRGVCDRADRALRRPPPLPARSRGRRRSSCRTRCRCATSSGSARRSPRPPAVFANRGANGIDGVVSTALGVACGGSRGRARSATSPSCTTPAPSRAAWASTAGGACSSCVDNRGGAIFSFLPQRALGRRRIVRAALRDAAAASRWRRGRGLRVRGPRGEGPRRARPRRRSGPRDRRRDRRRRRGAGPRRQRRAAPHARARARGTRRAPRSPRWTAARAPGGPTTRRC